MGLIKLTEEEKQSGPDPDDEKKYKEFIERKEEELRKIEDRDSVANLEHFKSINVLKDDNEDEDFVSDEEDEEEEKSSHPFSSPPAFQTNSTPLPEFDAPRRGRPPKTARNEDVFHMLLSINATLNDITRRLSVVESNQKKLAELEVKAVCNYIHQDHEQLIGRIKKLTEQNTDPSTWIDPLRSDLRQSFSESEKRLDLFEERINDLCNEFSKTKDEVEDFSRLCASWQQPAIEEKKPSAPCPSDLRTLCMKAFESIIAPLTPPTSDDYARIDRIFDLALQRSNTNNNKATELFVFWIHEFYSYILDHEDTERTVYEFFRFVFALVKTS